MMPSQMPDPDFHYERPTIEEMGRRVARARERYNMLAISQAPDDEVERMRASIRLNKAAQELASAEHVLRAALETNDRPQG